MDPASPASLPDFAHRARERAAAALALRRWDDAIAAAVDAIGRDPGHYRGHGLLAQALLGRKRHTDAQRAAEAGIAVAPAQEWLHRLRSLALREQGRLPEALAAADEAVRLVPRSGFAHYTRALALARMKRLADARVALAGAVELEPRNPDFHRDLGDLYLDSEPSVAETHYRTALRISPNDAYALNNLGVALRRQRRRDEALAAFKQAMTIDPSLGAAKRNTHSTAREALQTGGWIVVLVLGLNLVRLIVVDDSAVGDSGLLGAVVALVLAATIGSSVWLRTRRKKALSRVDPQLYEIYRALDADKKAGRL